MAFFIIIFCSCITLSTPLFGLLIFRCSCVHLSYCGSVLLNLVILCRSTIRDKIIPHAVSWFTGEAADEFDDIEVDDEDLDEDNEDEDEDEEEEEDEDDEEEEERKTRKKVL